MSFETQRLNKSLSILSRLEELWLQFLPKPESIYRRALLLPSLKLIDVGNCPNLRKLPLNSNSATNTLESIEGEFMWWEGLEWEDDNLKAHFQPIFQLKETQMRRWL